VYEDNSHVEIDPKNVKPSSLTNFNNINSIFDDKINDFSIYGFFPQIYEASLQAMYYGLYILDSIGKLEIVNKTQMVKCIMSTYNEESNVFIDSYALRYLDTDFTESTVYPLTSLLEVNCYAILSLDLLNSLDLIDIGKSIDFIKSCYNPITSGFIGQPFSYDLEYYAKISSMDNTYYALKALDLLMDTWVGYTQQRDEIVQYINNLQETNNSSWEFGGFANDNESFYFSLKLYADINMFSSYYSFKSLEIFGMEASVSFNNFNEFLEELYNDNENSFYYMKGNSRYDVVTTALGLNVANITGFSSYNESGVIEFLFENRNNLGIWDGSSDFDYHELIDTFQILRVLNDIGSIARLTLTDTNQIANTIITYFSNPQGFSLISMDYVTNHLLHTIISSFDLYDKLPDIDLQELYNEIIDTYYYKAQSYHGFWGVTNPESIGEIMLLFRSFPIEFHTIGKKIEYKEIEYPVSHQSTYYALRSLKTIFKLDDFASICNFNKLMEDIISTQFLNSSYPDQYGGFSYIYPYGSAFDGFLAKDIHFKYTYYAIKALELLAEELNIGDITFLTFNIPALQSFINQKTVETTEIIYFNPPYSDNVETILEYTYYMLDLFQTLDLLDINNSKVSNLIAHNLDYSNIKNIYYCYKIVELLELDLEFDIELVQLVVSDIFSQELNEFYLTTQSTVVDQEIFMWICEMASLHNYKIIAHYQEEVMLGNYINIDASLSNIILSYFDYNLSFAFETPQLGYFEFEKIGINKFSLYLHIPQHPSNYPSIIGKIYALDNTVRIAELTLSFSTFYPEKIYQDEINTAVVLSVLFIVIPGGVIFYSEKKLKKKDPSIHL
jgi:prenyltransferase beta subunit